MAESSLLDQAIQQTGKHPSHWPKGTSGNPAGRPGRNEIERRIEEYARELAAEFGGFDTLSPSEQLLIRSAAKLALLPVSRGRRRTDEMAIRRHNAIQRSLSIIRKSRDYKRKATLRLRQK